MIDRYVNVFHYCSTNASGEHKNIYIQRENRNKDFFCKCKKEMYIHVYILYICNPQHGSSAVYKMYFIRLYMMLCIVFKLILLS